MQTYGVVSGSNVNPLGYISYNGFVFAGPRFRWSVSVQPKISEDGRTTIGNVYKLSVRYIATDDADGVKAHISNTAQRSIWGARSILHEARTRLTKSGGCLIIRNMGFDITLNCPDYGGPNNLWDTNYGPKCVDLQIKPVANGVCNQIDWTCEWTIPECVVDAGQGHPGYKTPGSSDSLNTSYIRFPFPDPANNVYVESFTLNVGFTIDVYGLTSRVVSGSVVIPLNRSIVTGDDSTGGGSEIYRVADELRELIAPPIPLGYRRVRQEWSVSPDGKTLSFSITDEELPDRWPYPPGILRLDMRHSVQATEMSTVGESYIRCNISGSFEVAKGYSLNNAFNRIILIVQGRIDHAIQANAAQGDVGRVDGVGRVVVTAMSITEKIYGGIGVEFSVDYMILKAITAIKMGLVPATGLFKNPGGNAILGHYDWALSLGYVADMNLFMKNKPVHQRGISDLKYGFANNPIVGPCDINDSLPAFNDYDIPDLWQDGGNLSLSCPDTGFAYLEWDSNIIVIVSENLAEHVPLKPPNSGQDPDTYEMPKSDEGADVVPVPITPANPNLPDNVVEKLTPRAKILINLRGRARRIARHPFIPTKLNDRYKVFRNVLIPTKNNYVKRKKTGRIGPCPVFGANWSIYYRVNWKYPEDIERVIGSLEQLLGWTEDDPVLFKLDKDL